MKACRFYHRAYVMGRVVSWRTCVTAVIPSASLLRHKMTLHGCWLQESARLHRQSSDSPFQTHGEHVACSCDRKLSWPSSPSLVWACQQGFSGVQCCLDPSVSEISRGSPCGYPVLLAFSRSYSSVIA